MSSRSRKTPEPDAQGRSSNGVTAEGRVDSVPDPEVQLVASRRRFSPTYKLRILKEIEQCREPGEVGAILRREGLYSSLISAWRAQLREGALSGPVARKRGPKARGSAERGELDRLRRENARLQARAEHAEKIIALQKKACDLLGIPLTRDDPDEPN